MNKNDIKNISTIKSIAIQAISQANSGHPGIVLGATDFIYYLYAYHLNINANDPYWINRDRFVLSAGHGSALLYSILHFAGFNVSIDDIKNFRQLHSLTPGHPEYKLTEGVDATTGPLGQGIAMGVGMAIAEKNLAAKFNKPDCEIFNHKTYVVCGDGDLQEGISYESLSLAGHLNLNKLVILYDSNDIQLDSEVRKCTSENTKLRMQSIGFEYHLLNDYNFEFINEILNKVQTKPLFIEIKTIIGNLSKFQATNKVHGSPLEKEDLNEILNKLLEKNNFEHDPSVKTHFSSLIKNRCEANYLQWKKAWNHYQKNYREEFELLNKTINNDFSWITEKLNSLPDKNQATRECVGECLQILNECITLIGGSADLASSTKVKGKDPLLSEENFSSSNIFFGVREFAMGSITNGINLHQGLFAFCATFLSFADYMKASIRLACIQKLKSLFIFSHDSLCVGEDGPTHQPVEQISMLRSIPRLFVFRPCDMQETIAAFNFALNLSSSPTSIVTSRQKINCTNLTNSTSALKGAYFLIKTSDAKLNIIATGSEVELALKIVDKLNREHQIKANLISAPCLELFDKQSNEYQNEVLNPAIPTFSIELASTFGWAKYTKNEKHCFGYNEYGLSAKAEDILKFIGFEAENLTNKILKLLKNY